jgi:hypothetical protein
MVPGPPATANRLQVNYQHVNVADDDLVGTSYKNKCLTSY